MRENLLRRALMPAFGVFMLGLTAASQGALVSYSGNGATGFGGLVGNGSVSVSDSGGNLTVTFNPNGTFNGNDLVLYIDSVPGGFTNTSTFFDNGDAGREAVAGANAGNSQTLAVFPTGFAADYAIEFENTIYTGLFGLASGGNNSLNYINGSAPAGGTFSVTFPLSNIGISAGQSFNFVGTYISTSAYRSNETIGASVTTPGSAGDTPNAGFNGQTTFTSSDQYATTAVPEPTSLLGLAASGILLLRRRSAAAR